MNISKGSSFLLVFFLFLLVSGCGSGSSSSDKRNNDNDNLSSTGETFEAVINSENAIDLAVGAYSGGSAGSISGAFGRYSAQESSPMTQSVFLGIHEAVRSFISEATANSFTHPTASGASFSETGTYEGMCGGTASYSIKINKKTGKYKSEVTYEDFCVLDVMLSGSSSYSGKISRHSGYAYVFDVVFNDLYIRNSCGLFVFAGNIHYSISGNSLYGTMNTIMREYGRESFYKTENYRVVFHLHEEYLELTHSGRYQHPAHGYVTVSTEVPFRIYNGYTYPSEGMLIVTGSVAEAGSNTSARFSAMSSSSYAVESDADGDGVYEWARVIDWVGDCHINNSRLETEPPEEPSNLSANAVSDSQINLTWNASQDNLMVTGYNLYRNGEHIKSSATTSTEDTGLHYYTEYCYSVAAYDAGGNESEKSPEVCVTTYLKELFNKGQTLNVDTSGNLALGDLDNDGDLDVIFSNQLFTNNGYGSFSKSGAPFDQDYGLKLADLDGDGDLDAIGKTKILVNDGNASFTARDSGSVFYKNIALGDLDADGDLDIYYPHYRKPDKIYLNDGKGYFSDSGQELGNSSTIAAALGDLDGDGDLDAFVTNWRTPNMVWINDGNGIFSDSGQKLGRVYGTSVALGDVDGDNDIDAVVSSSISEPTQIWLNDGQGVFSKGWHNNRSECSPRGVSLTDINGDGLLDIYEACWRSDFFWLNNGEGIFSMGIMYLPNYSSNGGRIGDINQDGDIDIVTIYDDYKRARIWHNTLK